MPEQNHLIGLACGHFRPAEGFADVDATWFLDAMRTTNDSALCAVCSAYRKVTGPLVKVLAQ